MIYRLLRQIISTGGFDPIDMKNKLDVYFALKRITEEQYHELSSKLTTK